MAAPTTALPIPPNAQENVIKFVTAAISLYGGSFNIRQQLEARDRAYYREQDQTKTTMDARAANQQGDATKIQNMTVPVVMPQVETALGYYTDTFLTSYPIFGAVAPAEHQDAIGQMDAINKDNQVQFGWVSNLMQTLRDGLKYDLGAIEVVWDKRKTFEIVTPEVKNTTVGKVNKTQYEGNVLERLDPYNLLLDVRVSPEKNHLEGEYAGYTKILSRIETKKRMDDLDVTGTMNFRKAWESGTPSAESGTSATGNYYTPSINPEALLPNQAGLEFSWLDWSGITTPRQNGAAPVAYRNSYEWTVIYCRIIPKEVGISVSDSSSIQIWKFIIINRAVVIFAERQTNAHNYLPIIVCKPSNDGFGYQSKSFAENVTPVQQISSALVNSGLSSQRRKVYDRLLYDPTRVRKQDIDNISPVARIPVKSAAMGKGLDGAVFQMPYRDDGAMETFQMSQQIVGMGDIISGQNRVQQGQFQKGNKTRKEFDTVMDNSNSRQRMGALALEETFFTPIKKIVLSNILQFQPPSTLVPTNQDGTQAAAVKVDPAVLRKALISFKLSDGLLPTDKMIDGSALQMVFSAAPSMPMLNVEYDLMAMLLYNIKLQGGGWIDQFKRTPQQQQQAMAQLQAANAAADPAAQKTADAQQTAANNSGAPA